MNYYSSSWYELSKQPSTPSLCCSLLLATEATSDSTINYYLAFELNHSIRLGTFLTPRHNNFQALLLSRKTLSLDS